MKMCDWICAHPKNPIWIKISAHGAYLNKYCNLFTVEHARQNQAIYLVPVQNDISNFISFIICSRLIAF